MASLVPPSNSNQSSPRVVSTPQHHKIIEDIKECIKQLKDDFVESKNPINDDNQTLHRFCAKLEYLLQAFMKEKYSMLGRKKDYWDYFVDCLGSTKGVNDGIKYVKSLGEHKTSLGKGRAFIRFSLVHQRLPDTVQQCVQNTKTGEWFHPQSVWYQKKLTGDLVNSLYDLTDIHFDLSPRGYDLDAAWPSFAKKQGGNYTWNPPSRRSSISSMASITMQDTSSLMSVPLYADNSGEVEKLTQDLETSETVRSQLMEQVGSLQQEKMDVSQSAWSTQGELNAIQEQLKDLKQQHAQLQERYLQLEKRYDKVCLEKTSSENELKSKDKDLATKLQALTEEKNETDSKLEDARHEVEHLREEMQDQISKQKAENDRLESLKAELVLQVKSLEKEIQTISESEKLKSELVNSVEEKLKHSEMKNSELLTRIDMLLTNMESDSSATQKLQDILEQLKEVEVANSKLESSNGELLKRNEDLEKRLTSTEQLKSDLEEKFEKERAASEQYRSNKEAEVKNLTESTSSAMQELKTESEMKIVELANQKSELEKLRSEFEEECLRNSEKDKMLEEFGLVCRTLTENDYTDGVSDFKWETFRTDVQLFEQAVSQNLKDLTKQVDKLNDLNGALKSDYSKLSSEKEHLMENLEDLHQTLEENEKCHEKVRNDLERRLQNAESEREQKHLELQKKDSELNGVKREMDDRFSKLRESSDILEARTKQMELESEAQRKSLEEMLTSCALQEKNMPNLEFPQALSVISLHIHKLSTKISDLENEKAITEEQLSHLQAGDEDKGSKLFSLEEKFTSLQKSLSESRDTEADLRRSLVEKEQQLKDQLLKYKDLEVAADKKEVQLDKIGGKFEEVDRENLSLREQVSTLTHDLSELSVSVATTSEKLQTAADAKEKDLRQQEEVLKLKDSELMERSEKINILESENQSLHNNVEVITNLKTNCEKEILILKETSEKLQTELSSSHSRCGTLEKDLERERQSLMGVQKKQTDSSEELSGLRQKCESVEVELKSQIEKFDEIVKNYDTDRSQLTAQLEEAVNDAQAIQEQLKQTSSELEQACSLKERAEQEKEEVTVILNNLEASYKELKAKLNLFEEEGQEIVLAKKSVEMEKVNLNCEMEKLQSSLNDLEIEKVNSLTEKDEAINDLQTQLSGLSSQIEEFKASVQSLKREKTDLMDQVNSAEDRAESLQKSLDEKDDFVKGKELEMEGLQQSVEKLTLTVNSLEQNLEEKSRRCDELETLFRSQTNVNSQVESLTQEVTALQFQLSSEQLQYEESLKSVGGQVDEVNNLQVKVLEQESTIIDLQEELASVKRTREEESSQHRLELEELKKTLDSNNSEGSQLTEKLNKAESDLLTEVKEKEVLKASLQVLEDRHVQELEDKEKEITDLKSDMKQLKKQLIKLIKDKDTLWQKTDKLAYQQKVQAQDTWMDNNTATNCLTCKSEFSIWLRRHHCRMCGKIYCWKCVDNWVMTAHSSKKERVCDECFQHKQSVESETNTSLLSTASGSDEEEIDEELLQSLNVRGVTPSTDDHTSTTEYDDTTESDTCSQGIPVPPAPGSPNATDEHKVQKIQSQSTDTPAQGADSASGTTDPEDPFHVITDAEVTKSVSEYDTNVLSGVLSPNMSSSMILSAEDLESGEINRQNEIWVKPGKSFVVPIVIDLVNTELCWEFTSQPKDIVFSVTYRESESSPVDEAQELVAPCKCDSHKQAVQGTLLAKQTGLYTLIFDNTYSRMTAKRVHYSLQSRTSN